MSESNEDEVRGPTLAHIARLEEELKLTKEQRNEGGDMILRLVDRIGVLELALRAAARRFSFMASVGWINGVDPAVGYNECVAALQPEEDK